MYWQIGLKVDHISVRVTYNHYDIYLSISPSFMFVCLSVFFYWYFSYVSYSFFLYISTQSLDFNIVTLNNFSFKFNILDTIWTCNQSDLIYMPQFILYTSIFKNGFVAMFKKLPLICMFARFLGVRVCLCVYVWMCMYIAQLSSS